MGSALLGIAAVFLLVGINGFFVAAEFALVGARRTRIAQLANEGHSGAKAAQNAMEHLDSYIAATQLGITLASLGLGWIGEPAISHLIEPLLHRLLPESLGETFGLAVSIAVSFSFVTLLHIVLGELVPKSIALQRPEGTSVIIAHPTTWFLRLFRPIIWLMNGVGNYIVRLLGFELADGHAQVHSAEELEMLVQSSREAGILQASEEQLLRRVFDFSDLQTREIMQPRVEVNAISVNVAITDLMRFIRQEHHSRYPVYDVNMDHVIGVLHIKDLLDEIIQNPAWLQSDSTTFDLRSLLRETLFVPATLQVDHLLTQMQKTQIHLAIVLDEYGGMAGVVTLEDVLEELVGEVQDEFDTETTSIIEQDGVILLDGLLGMSEVEDRFGEHTEESTAATVGGYILEQLGRIPVIGDTIHYGAYDFRVQSMDGMRVSQVEVTKRASDHP